jgi:hypothetical protein
MMNARLVPDPPAVLTPGEAVAGMMLKGLGFANRPVSLTPPFLASTPRDLWWHDGVRAEMCNRFKRGRTLDAAEADGGDLRWQELARCVCAHAGIELRFNHLDTTRCARRGEDIPEREAQAMTIAHGDARAHRPDLKPVVLALRGAHDGGLPCGRQRWDGKTSDRAVFQARAQAWLAAFQPAPHPRARLADAKLHHEEHATHLRHLGCIPRLPNTRRSVSEAITHALAWDCWPRLEAHTREQRLELGHDGMAQRWLVVYAQAAYARAAATLHHARPRDDEAIHTPLLPFHARRFATPEAAPAALTAVATGWT